MDESNCVVHAHIRKPDDYQIVNDTPYDHSFVIKTELGDVILTIDFKIALVMAVDLVKAVTAHIKQDVNKEITDLTALEN
jgi:cell fate (sporulation/competence/biofilm development) regulator YmcA (YheA/YmcA/DUF963 family)